MTDWLDWFFFGCGVVAIACGVWLFYDLKNNMGRWRK
jgi:hypothetical protein